MNRRMRTYYYAVLGAIGGLVGWKVSDLLGLSFVTNIYLSEAIVGALIGLSIGFFIGITEGALTRNSVQAGKSGLTSGVLGLIAGAIGLPLSELLFQGVGAGWIGRSSRATPCSSAARTAASPRRRGLPASRPANGLGRRCSSTWTSTAGRTCSSPTATRWT